MTKKTRSVTLLDNSMKIRTLMYQIISISSVLVISHPHTHIPIFMKKETYCLIKGLNSNFFKTLQNIGFAGIDTKNLCCMLKVKFLKQKTNNHNFAFTIED